jgi:PAS domain-containing protein
MKSVNAPRPPEAEFLSLAEEEGDFGTWSWDTTALTFRWSSGLYRIFGVNPAETFPTLDLYRQAVHPADRDKFLNPIRMIASGALSDWSFRIVRPDGSIRWLRSTARIVCDETGSPTQVYGVAFDETRRRLERRAFDEQEGLFAALRELLQVVFWRTEADGTVSDQLEWWRATSQAGNTQGWNRLDVVHPEDRQAVRDAWDAAVRGGGTYGASYRASTADGYKLMVSRAVPTRDPGGQVIGWIGFTSGIFGDREGGDRESTRSLADRLTPALVRAARGMLDWTAHDLADEAKVSFSTVRRAETPGTRTLRDDSIIAIRVAFENAGLRFIVDRDGKAGVAGP